MKSTLVKIFGIIMIVGLLLSALSPIIYLFAPSIAIDPSAPVENAPPTSLDPSPPAPSRRFLD